MSQSKRPLVLNFSANDTAGLAGMSTDIRTQSAMGVHALSVLTANTAQNNASVLSINAVSDIVFDDQLAALASLPMNAFKVGLIASQYQCETIVHFLSTESTASIPLVLDPVLGSSSGSSFINDELLDTLKTKLLPCAALLTPNTIEASQLTGITITSQSDMVTAASALLEQGAKAILIKGGHFNEGTSDWVADYFSDSQKSFWLTSKKIPTSNSRGTGCALSSAIASALALGYPIYDAVVIGKMAISQGLRQSYSIEDHQQYGPVSITHFPDQQIDLPFLTQVPLAENKTLITERFPSCNQPFLGLYPVVESAQWIEHLAATGISTIQLRAKSLHGDALENEIIHAIRLAEKYQIRLFVNDYWQLAIKHGAYGIHLGQEDLDSADIQAIKASGVRLGISTHCHYEVARAHAYQPSYIACGPVYHTTTKDMPWVPHGLEGLAYWRKVLQYPLVAIGGINEERFDKVAASGVDSVAMITAITLAENPTQTAADFIDRFATRAVGSATSVESTSYD